MAPTSRPRHRRAATAIIAFSLLVPLGAACGNGDDQGTPLDRNSTENPNGGGSPTATTSPGDAQNQYSPGENGKTGDPDSGQPRAGSDDTVTGK